MRQSGRPRTPTIAIDRPQCRDADRSTEELTEGRIDSLRYIRLKEFFLKHRDANAINFQVAKKINNSKWL